MATVELFEFVRAGLLSNVDVEIVTAVFDMFDYQGKQPEATALRLDMRLVNDGEDGEVQSQYFTVGGSKDGNHLFVPSEDGQRLEDTGGRSSLALGSNYQALIDSLKACGFDPKKLPDGKIGGLDGTIGHVIRSKPPEGSYKGSSGEDGAEREILVFSEVNKFGYEAKGKKKTAAAKKKAPAKAKAAPEESAEEEDGDVDTSDIASTLAMEILSSVEEQLPISRLRLEVYKKTPDHDKEIRDAIGAHILDAEWLVEQGFTVEGKKVSIQS